MLGLDDHDSVFGISRHVGGATRSTPCGGPALVSRGELLKDWLALGDVCADPRLRVVHDGVFKQ